MPAISTATLTGRGNGAIVRQIKRLLGPLKFSAAAGDVNYLEISSAAAGAEPAITAIGSDTDIDIRLIPKGTAYVRFGTHVPSGDVVANGHILIKDAGGTLRKVMITA